jgi:hypothetical protein
MTKQDKLVGLIRGRVLAGAKVPTLEQMAKASGFNLANVRTCLVALKKTGVITYERGDYSTVRLLDAVPTKDAKSGTKLQGRRVAKGKRPQFALDERPAPVVPRPTGDLLASAAILLQPSEIVRVRGLIGAARAACDELETLVATAEKSPTIGGLLRGTLDRVLGVAAAGPASAIGLWPEATPAATDAAPTPKRTSKRTARKVPNVIEPPVVENEPGLEDVGDELVTEAPFYVLGPNGARLGQPVDTLDAAKQLLERHPVARTVTNHKGVVVAEKAAA